MQQPQQHRLSLLLKTMPYLLQLQLGLFEFRSSHLPFHHHHVVKVMLPFPIDLDQAVIAVRKSLHEGITTVKPLTITRLPTAHLNYQLQPPMNFLNKKYASLHTPPAYQHPNSHSYLPSPSSYREKAASLVSNNCQSHPNEMVRHLCLECVELLCAECISQHLQLHREANILPRIQSLKQVRSELEGKLDNIASIMSNRSPNFVDVEEIRRKTLEKVEQMRKDVVRAVQQWVGIMRDHLLQNMGINDMTTTKKQMQKLCEEVKVLRSALQGSSHAEMVKKAYKLDGQMLEEGYLGMFQKYRELEKNTEFEFTINWKEIINSLEANINVKRREHVQESEAEESTHTPFSPSKARAEIKIDSPRQ